MPSRALLPLFAIAAVAGLVARSFATREQADRHPRYWAEWEQRDLADPFVWVALGDSTSQAVGVDDPDDGWIAATARRLETELGRPVRVVNLAISGGRIDALVERQLPRLRELLVAGPVDLVTCAIGANDAFKRGYDPEEFRRGLDAAAAVMPTGSVMVEVPYFGPAWSGIGLVERRALVLNDIVADVARRHGHLLAPLHEAMAALWPREVLGAVAEDFFHPNARGYEVWTRVIGQTIDQALAARRSA